MKIKSLQVSNILTFKHYDDIENAPNIEFDKDFNILIGQNGSGKSTVLEIINFIFRRVLLVPYNRNDELYEQKSTIDLNQRKSILKKIGNIQSYKNFNLERNYDFEDKTQKIKVTIQLDEIDLSNIKILQDNKDKLSAIVGLYSSDELISEGSVQNEYVVEIELNSSDKTFVAKAPHDLGFMYLTGYNLYKYAIELYNSENNDHQISNFSESFALIGSYKNYSSYTSNASLGGGNTAERQIEAIRNDEYSKSTNTSESSEPTIFSLVRLRMASECFHLITTNKTSDECEESANSLDFIQKINDKIKIINLKVEIKLTGVSNWNFSFLFRDIKRNKTISNINSLSAGQKAILHLVFEAYGRGKLKGGLIIIDEPEIHLHYQFQNEYLRVINKLNLEQESQYILVTHSEALITSDTIEKVVRLSLDNDNYTKINHPIISTEQKWLVKILDNRRSTHSFFGSKIIFVEGEHDRYFYRSLVGLVESKLKNGLSQDISILEIGGRDNILEWRNLFNSFGLKTYFITDLDYAYNLYPREQKVALNTSNSVDEFINKHNEVVEKIEKLYEEDTFILKRGDLEAYIDVNKKDLSEVINFCNNNIEKYFNTKSDKVVELKTILSKIVELDLLEI